MSKRVNRNNKENRKETIDMSFEEMFDELRNKTEEQKQIEDKANADTPANDDVPVLPAVEVKKKNIVDKVWNKLPKPMQTVCKIVGMAGVVVVGGVVIFAIGSAFYKKNEDGEMVRCDENGNEYGTYGADSTTSDSTTDGSFES